MAQASPPAFNLSYTASVSLSALISPTSLHKSTSFSFNLLRTTFENYWRDWINTVLMMCEALAITMLVSWSTSCLNLAVTDSMPMSLSYLILVLSLIHSSFSGLLKGSSSTKLLNLVNSSLASKVLGRCSSAESSCFCLLNLDPNMESILLLNCTASSILSRW